ncbi:MAG TPA: lipoprotein [Gammaproteobacteria bacterium]|nr:lipoprotein [Gammaproteobacteria bacterium]
MRALRHLLWAAALAALTLGGLWGCGQKGPLYLPHPGQQPSQQQSPGPGQPTG